MEPDEDEDRTYECPGCTTTMGPDEWFCPGCERCESCCEGCADP